MNFAREAFRDCGENIGSLDSSVQTKNSDVAPCCNV